MGGGKVRLILRLFLYFESFMAVYGCSSKSLFIDTVIVAIQDPSFQHVFPSSLRLNYGICWHLRFLDSNPDTNASSTLTFQ